MEQDRYWEAVAVAFFIFILFALWIVVGVVIGYGIDACLNTEETFLPIINWCVGLFAVIWYFGGLATLLTLMGATLLAM